MAEEKTETKKIEREYVIPLRKEFLKVPQYRRAGRAAKAIKQFIAKHMKVENRDVNKVKVDMYINNEIWARGKTNPPSRIKVKAIKEGDIVKVEFVETPEYIKFLKAKHAKFHKEETKEQKKEEAKKPEEKEVKEVKEEEKKAELEKEKSVEQEKIKEAKAEKKEQKHAAKEKKIEFHRRSMSRH